MKGKSAIIIAWLIAAALVFGCGPKKRVPPMPYQAYTPMDFQERDIPVKKQSVAERSSLWYEDNNANWLFTDHKARKVNDVITVQILEESVAKKKAETKTNRGSTIGAGISGLFGLERQMAKANPDMNLDTLVGAKFDNQFTGKGETTRSGKLVATISAVVVDVLPNGNLLIRGKRAVKVNNEEEIIILSGVVRPRDVASDNSVLSTLVADAKIEYIGRGVIADKQKPGWFGRAMDKGWPF